jgi:PAS domain S-box-containing protein
MTMMHLNPSQANVAESCVMPAQIASERTTSAAQPVWLGALAATAVFAICCAAPLLVFPKLSASALAPLPILLFAAIASFVAYRSRKAERAFDEERRVLQQQCVETEQRALEMERRALLCDEFVAMSREWEATFDALPEGAFLFDATGRLSRINRAGVLLEDSEAASPGSLRCCDMFWRVEGATGCAVERAQSLGETVEVEMSTGAKADHSVLVIVVPIKDECGTLTGNTIVIARDVSELRRAEAEAFEHKSFLASLADLAPDEIYMLDAEGRFVWMNERAEAANDVMRTGLLLGKWFGEIISAESREAADIHLRRTLAGEDAQCEVQVVRADGAVRFVEAHSSPRWKDGAVSGALVFLRDMTERRRTQERMAQSDKLRAVGELAAGVAHNLNNSLTVIQGRAQLLLMRSTDEATSKSLETITRAVAEGSQTLRRILEFARRGPARDFALVDLAELIDSSVEIAKPKWQNKRDTDEREQITVRVENQGAVLVMGEAGELREVVLNLLFNAVDALHEGGGIIETGTRAEIDGACFWVADTGHGMTPEVVERIFEPFYTTKGEFGTGLGLSASHGIIARHGGRIMVVSEPGEGTRFEVRLPLYIPKLNRAISADGALAPLLVRPSEDKAPAPNEMY